MDETIDTDGVQRLVGRTIIVAQRDARSSDPWPLDDQTLYLTLDDGSEWTFVGWGHDASGLEITATPAVEKVNDV